DVKRSGSDVTIVATSIQVSRALEAANRLAREDGIEVEVVDPRTLEPLDRATIFASVRKTGRVVVTDESHENAASRRGSRRSSQRNASTRSARRSAGLRSRRHRSRMPNRS